MKTDWDETEAGSNRSMRADAEEQLARCPKISPDLADQSAEALIHELQVHQVELETQAEELRRAQLALRASRDKNLDLYEFAPLGYFTISDKSLITGVNLTGTVLFDIERNDLVTTPFSRFMSEKDSDQWHRYFMNLLNREERQTCTLTLTRGDGSTFPARLEGVRLPDSNNGETTLRIVISDISDIRKIEEALSQANKKINLLSGITRHDINNQLALQMGYLSILEDTPLDPSQKEYFQMVMTAAERISAMIKFTREYEQIGESAPAWQDCHRLVDAGAKEALLGKVRVNNSLPSGTEILSDPLIGGVFYNLIDNAARYGGKITTIRFYAEKAEDVHLIVCEDDGNGVPTGDKERIFERGFRKNTGMSLFLSREILDITGITISETGEPGKGARFELRVPKDKWRMTGGDA
jgi:PAS domain S-box-containing protein